MRSAPPLGDELTARLGTPKRVRTLGSSPRSNVWRATLGGTPVVIKHLVAGPGADELLPTGGRGAARRHVIDGAVRRWCPDCSVRIRPSGWW